MATSSVELANLALSHLGDTKGIASMDERSDPARACNRWYEQCRDEVLRDFAWPFAITTATLALVEEFDSDTAEWAYSYTYPSDALYLTRSPYGSSRTPTNDTTQKWRIVRNASGGKLLYIDQDEATIEYVAQVTDPTEFPPDFTVALSYLLASRIAPAVTSEARKENMLLMLQLYKDAIGNARANALNEQAPDVPPDSGFITARA